MFLCISLGHIYWILQMFHYIYFFDCQIMLSKSQIMTCKAFDNFFSPLTSSETQGLSSSKHVVSTDKNI